MEDSRIPEAGQSARVSSTGSVSGPSYPSRWEAQAKQAQAGYPVDRGGLGALGVTAAPKNGATVAQQFHILDQQFQEFHQARQLCREAAQTLRDVCGRMGLYRSEPPNFISDEGVGTAPPDADSVSEIGQKVRSARLDLQRATADLARFARELAHLADALDQ
jgi:hypothetical protein